MKKLSLFLPVSIFAFCGCNDENDGMKGGDDSKEGENEKKEVAVSFEDQLTESESKFTSTSTEVSEYCFKNTFTDPEGYVTFGHYCSNWGREYGFAGFAYTNETSHFQNCQPNCGNIRTGEVYLGVYSSEDTTASMAIIDSQYSVKGLWITTNKSAYVGMTEGGGCARPFKKGDWYEVTAAGYGNKGKRIAETKIKLADYKADTDKPVNTWIWFDLTPLKDTSKITLIPSSSDSGELGTSTSRYFCIDSLTLVER